MYYRELLRSEYPEDRERAMAELRERIRTGALRGSFETIRDVLRETAFAVFRRPVYRDGELVNDYPDLRAEAARLLGAIGGVEEQEAFARLLLLEYEWSVRTEIVSAMGRIGADPDGSVSRAIYGAVRELRPNRPQERFARAVLQTFSTFLRYHRAPPDPAVFESLERLREMDLSRSLRRRAHELLSSAGS
jgi:HEAT repeat protein